MAESRLCHEPSKELPGDRTNTLKARRLCSSFLWCLRAYFQDVVR